jgi:predicted flap endonuclease-1-like 5' DNA nuclease
MAEESLKEQYNRLLREGRTEEATEVAQELSDGTARVEPAEEEVESEDEIVSEQERFAELSGVGEELADEMVQVFGTYDSFVEEADVDSLSDISGIGGARAESLIDQVKEREE